MSSDVQKWIPFFSQHVRFHGNQDFIYLALFGDFSSEKCLYWDKLDWQCLARKVNDSYISQQPPLGTVYW